MQREQAKAIIEKLVERFSEHQKDYHLPDYNEQKARQDFINPFFKALGWDIDNEKGDSEAYREVIYEDKVVVRGKAKAPDYGFRLSGSGKKRLFYVEAKKPSIQLKTNKESAYQLRRYGSSAQALVSILTNFEDFIVYDCSKVPNLNDSASVARLKHIHFLDYVKEFDFIFDTFSHEAVTKGRFDKFVQSDANKKGSQTLDKEFVQSLDQWRKYLATSIAVNNKKINDEELNYAVQQTIDRLIFLRFCEDRAVEPYAQLQQAVSKGDEYKNLLDLFKQADDKYNSGLFDFKKDQITPALKIDTKVLKGVIDELYYPLCRYEFAVMPVEVLGNAYEQFLGKVIRITPARGVKIEEKPEVRKAGGVYYTPQYIVEYIVKNTVGKLIDGKTPKEIEKIKIVDPACGSGSFLLGAFEYVLNYHVNYYHQKGFADKKTKDNPFTPQGTLTTHEKKRILLNNIYGVDLDANAVEVTKLSLLLKCMEGETEASIKQQVSMFHERVLPSLEQNIKDGNSLIDTDFYDNEIDLGFEKNIKPFSWKKQFPEVFKQGGFDAVIGNPPYVVVKGGRYTSFEESPGVINYYKTKYHCLQQQINLYVAFLEISFKLSNPNGFSGFIVPNTLLTNDYCEDIRKYFLNKASISILNNEGRVFQDAVVEGLVIIYKNKKTKSDNLIKTKYHNIEYKISQDFFETTHLNRFLIHLTNNASSVLKKIKEKSTPLNVFAEVWRGLTTGDDSKFLSVKRIDKNFKPIVQGKSIDRFYIETPKIFVNYIPEKLDRARNPEIFEQKEKLISKFVGKNLVFGYDDKQLYAINTCCVTYLKKGSELNTKLLLGILNSKVLDFYFSNIFTDYRDAFPLIKSGHLELLPIKISKKKNINDGIITQVNLLLKLNEEIKSEKLQSKIEQIKTRIEHSEEKINQLVYELYELTSEEIKIIEGENK